MTLDEILELVAPDGAPGRIARSFHLETAARPCWWRTCLLRWSPRRNSQ